MSPHSNINIVQNAHSNQKWLEIKIKKMVKENKRTVETINKEMKNWNLTEGSRGVRGRCVADRKSHLVSHKLFFIQNNYKHLNV